MDFEVIKQLLRKDSFRSHRPIINIPLVLVGTAIMAFGLSGCNFGFGPGVQLEVAAGPGTLTCGYYPLHPPHHPNTYGCEYGISWSWNEAMPNAVVNEIESSNLSVVTTAQNVSVPDGTYTAVVSLYDQSNNLIAADNVSAYIAGGSAHISNIDALAAWVEAHDADARGMKLALNGIKVTPTTSSGTGTVTATQYIDGAEQGASTSVFQIGGGGGGGCISGQPCHHPPHPGAS